MSKTGSSFNREKFSNLLAEYQKLIKAPSSEQAQHNLDKVRDEFLSVAVDGTFEAFDHDATFWLCHETVYGDFYGRLAVDQIITLLSQNVKSGHAPSLWLLGTILTNENGRTPDEFVAPRRGIMLIAKAARKGYAPAQTTMLGYYDRQLTGGRYYQKKAYAMAQELAARQYPTGYLYLGECALQPEAPGPKGRDIALGFFERAHDALGNLDFVERFLEGKIRYRLGMCYYEGWAGAARKEEGLTLIRAAGEYDYGASDWLDEHGYGAKEMKERSPAESGIDRFAEIVAHIAKFRDYPAFEHDRDPPIQVIRLKKPFSFELELAQKAKEQEERELSEAAISEILKPLDDLTGLADVKRQIRELVHYAQIIKRRKQAGLSASNLSLHMVFSGNPGTGKTTVARVLGKVMADLGFLKSGHVVEVDRSGLVGEYIGETAQKTRRAADNARGGILFIDEAQALVPSSSEKDFGWEAIDTLTKIMEDRRDNFIVIAAGYKGDIDGFVNANTGLASRFTRYIDFPDFSAEEMAAIFAKMCADADYDLSSAAAGKFKAGVKEIRLKEGRKFANGRTVRKLFESALRSQAERIMRDNLRERADLVAILPEDIRFDFTVSDGSVTFFPKK